MGKGISTALWTQCSQCPVVQLASSASSICPVNMMNVAPCGRFGSLRYDVVGRLCRGPGNVCLNRCMILADFLGRFQRYQDTLVQMIRLQMVHNGIWQDSWHRDRAILCVVRNRVARCMSIINFLRHVAIVSSAGWLCLRCGTRFLESACRWAYSSQFQEENEAQGLSGRLR
jgi:hypothetical protein